MAMCRAISEYGLSLLKDGDGILTHCNAGPLATSRTGPGRDRCSSGKSGAWSSVSLRMRRARSCRARG